MDQKFNSSFGITLSVDQVIDEVARFMRDDAQSTYKIIIGTDSALLRNNEADFVMAVVIHRIGKGGRYFWRRIKLDKFFTLRDRIIREVLLSLDLAKLVLEKLVNVEKNEANTLPRWSFEIHADVGENGSTKVIIQEVVGMIRAHNFEARIKPESYAASSVADKHV